MSRAIDKLPKGWSGLTSDFSSDQKAFKEYLGAKL